MTFRDMAFPWAAGRPRCPPQVENGDGQTWRTAAELSGSDIINGWQEQAIGRATTAVRLLITNAAPAAGKLGGITEVEIIGP